ncbi:integumentary mucin C.1-like [Formica exsecta]|uniref:integumentary mucin C.1-like n=1 Tax=Formica exsecta TaxID=72781 RepID=UPI001144B4E6|nr:integumentary mucin C.1-like [Formica exsecta]
MWKLLWAAVLVAVLTTRDAEANRERSKRAIESNSNKYQNFLPPLTSRGIGNQPFTGYTYSTPKTESDGYIYRTPDVIFTIPTTTKTTSTKTTDGYVYPTSSNKISTTTSSKKPDGYIYITPDIRIPTTTSTRKPDIYTYTTPGTKIPTTTKKPDIYTYTTTTQKPYIYSTPKIQI